MKRALAVVIAVASSACAKEEEVIVHSTPESEEAQLSGARADVPGVTIGDAAPGDGWESLGEISATSGDGCGPIGNRGTEAGARYRLKQQAAALGASYVRVLDVEKPQSGNLCVRNTYTIRGEAYRARSR
jgi:hypothetical protein